MKFLGEHLACYQVPQLVLHGLRAAKHILLAVILIVNQLEMFVINKNLFDII